jgi:hypothetical protein
MFKRSLTASILAAGLAAAPSPVSAQAPAKYPERAIRHDIPMTNIIRRAFAAGTRDSTGRPGHNYWQQWMDYTINARLDPATYTISGRETIVLHNNSDAELSTINLRLDPNIYQRNIVRHSTSAETTDGMIVTKLMVNGAAVDLEPTMGGGRGGRGGRGAGGAAPPTGPAAARGIHTTVAQIFNLASPIAAKGSATLDVEWHYRVPGGTEGSGHRMTLRWGDSVFQATQWYPRVAVYDDLRGWDPEVYMGPSEFYNNFGRFDVTIDVPAGWLVAATGVLKNPQEVLTPTARERLSHVLESDSVRTIVGSDEFGPGKSTVAGDRLVWHFVADTVNDFAWGSAKEYIWRATRANIPGKGPVPVNMFNTVTRANAYANAATLASHALEFYSKMWMPYAFPTFSVVDGPNDGMEYPMLIMSSQGAADHETGHQWWPMMVSNNETWYGWMDEGFNQYMNILSGADRNHQPANLDGPGQNYGRMSGSESEAPMMWNANYGGPGYSYQTYSKTPLMLSMLGGIVGDSAVWRAQSEYAKAWRFKHPSPWDYMFMMSNSLHQDLGWFWYYWLFTTESVEGSIQKVTTSGARTTVVMHQAGQMPSPVVLKVQFAAKGPAIKPMSNSKMTDSVTAIVTWPVDVWFAGNRTFNAELNFGGRAIEKITLDPFGRFPDRDLTDNVWPRDPNAGQATGRGRGG